MNAHDILMYGNRTVQHTLEGIPDTEWDTPDVCGWWSTRQIIAHLASFEWMLVDAFCPFVGGEPTGALERAGQLGGQGFNDYEVEQRQGKSFAEVLAEYNQAHARTMEQVAQIPAETLQEAGRIPWYGMAYALDDLIVYQYYGHKREHTSQINIFKDLLKAQGKLGG
jgi:DinB superfamily